MKNNRSHLSKTEKTFHPIKSNKQIKKKISVYNESSISKF